MNRMQHQHEPHSFLSCNSLCDEIISPTILNNQIPARFTAGIDDLVFDTRRNHYFATRRQGMPRITVDYYLKLTL